MVVANGFCFIGQPGRQRCERHGRGARSERSKGGFCLTAELIFHSSTFECVSVLWAHTVCLCP